MFLPRRSQEVQEVPGNGGSSDGGGDGAWQQCSGGLLAVAGVAGCLNSTVTKSADFGFIPDNSTTLTPPGSPGVARETKLSTEFEFGSLVR